MAEDESGTDRSQSHEASRENFEVQEKPQQAALASIPEETGEEDGEDAMVGPVLPKARKRRVSSTEAPT